MRRAMVTASHPNSSVARGDAFLFSKALQEKSTAEGGEDNDRPWLRKRQGSGEAGERAEDDRPWLRKRQETGGEGERAGSERPWLRKRQESGGEGERAGERAGGERPWLRRKVDGGEGRREQKRKQECEPECIEAEKGVQGVAFGWEWYCPHAAHKRYAAAGGSLAVRRLHESLAKAHLEMRMNGVCGEEAVREALSAAVAESKRLVEEEREMEMEKRLGRNSRVYNELQRQKKEALEFWYHLQESAQMAAASEELQKEFGVGS